MEHDHEHESRHGNEHEGRGHDHEGHEGHDGHQGHDHEGRGRSQEGPRGPRGGMRRGPGHDRDPRGGGRGRWGGERGGWGGGRRMARGDIRRAILSALKDGPAHGYAVMRRLEESGGLWRPSPGSVYPHLQMLEDEGMVGSSEKDGTRTFHLTDAGVAEAANDSPLPWQARGETDDQIRNLRLAVTQLMGAAKQLSGAGENAQVERGIAVVQKARKELYQILAED
jgi:DNA-binding PadR family transcriptional regulator